MILTPRFVYVHPPKTGGTFVATVLMELHRRRGDTVMTVHLEPGSRESRRLAALRERGGFCVRVMQPDQHGTVRDVPPGFEDLPVVASVRNPWDRYVSQFAFAWWKRDPGRYGSLALLRARYPGFPDISFDVFLRFANRFLVPFPELAAASVPFGLQAQQLAVWTFRRPLETLRRLRPGEGVHERVAGDLAVTRWLRTHRLNEDLARWLESVGYAEEETAAVRAAKRIYPPEGGRPATDSWRSRYDLRTLELVRRLEWLVLELVPDLDDQPSGSR